MLKSRESGGFVHVRMPRAKINKLEENKHISVPISVDRRYVRRGATVYANSLANEKLKCRVVFIRRRFFKTGYMLTVRAM